MCMLNNLNIDLAFSVLEQMVNVTAQFQARENQSRLMSESLNRELEQLRQQMATVTAQFQARENQSRLMSESLNRELEQLRHTKGRELPTTIEEMEKSIVKTAGLCKIWNKKNLRQEQE
ncbi:uncharacterized protein LOC121388885 [Gigantopelta aegis]|uniref:uncharacterized protein LOC121388885 n=1 Tax=Gigantopelta aegis TaxID=1735272 RepID=UPI001B88E06A|nr:uncharacterized protein LOC121388885 [Gigantopelta aegis]